MEKPRNPAAEEPEAQSSAGSEEAGITDLLQEWSQGDSQAFRQLMPLVVDELRRVARRYFAQERKDHTLQPTALVNEVFLSLVDRRKVSWQNRAQFFGFAAKLMRRALVDHARRHRADKRGGDATKVSINEAFGLPESRDVDLTRLDDALKDLAQFDPEGSRVVELRFFAGLTYDEIAEFLDLPSIRIRRQWTAAKLWLFRELSQKP